MYCGHKDFWTSLKQLTSKMPGFISSWVRRITHFREVKEERGIMKEWMQGENCRFFQAEETVGLWNVLKSLGKKKKKTRGWFHTFSFYSCFLLPPETHYVSMDVEENIWFGFDVKGGVMHWMTSWYMFSVGGEEQLSLSYPLFA